MLRRGNPGSAAEAAEPAVLVPQHSWVADSVRPDLAAPGTRATWRTSAPRLRARGAGDRVEGGGEAERACPGAEMGQKGFTLTGGRRL